MNEREISFFKTRGHDHDGVNSTLVNIQPKQVKIPHLNTDVMDYMRTQAKTAILEYYSLNNPSSMAIRELQIVTPSIAPGDSYTASVSWCSLTIVRDIYFEFSNDTEITFTSYHTSSYDSDDTEFELTAVIDQTRYSGLWAHYDSSQGNLFHYRVENTGLNSAVFTITIQASTLSSNSLVDYVHKITTPDNVENTGELVFVNGDGVDITSDGTSITISAVPAETIVINEWSLLPIFGVDIFTSYGGGITDPDSAFSSYMYDYAKEVSFGTGSQWLAYDLGDTYNVGKVAVIFPLETSINSTYIQTSVDGIIWDQVSPLSDISGLNGTPLEVHFPLGKSAAYVRVWMNGTSAGSDNRICRILVWVAGS